jgi:hypothetical protein
MNAKNTETFRIYVADLHEYNSGRLIGTWLTPGDYGSVEELAAAISRAMTHPDHEWAIHDSEYVKVGEHESLAALLAIAEASEEWGTEKVQAAIDYGIADSLEDIGDAIADHDGGEFASKEDWAEEYISSCYDLGKMLGNLANYFDYKAFARDAELGGDISFVRLPGAHRGAESAAGPQSPRLFSLASRSSF